MPEAPAQPTETSIPKMEPGKPVWQAGAISFSGAAHPELDAAKKKRLEAVTKVEAIIKGNPELASKMEAIVAKTPQTISETYVRAAFGDAKALATQGIDTASIAEVRDLLKKHASAEFSELEQNYKETQRLEKQLAAAQLKLLKKTKITEIQGYSEAEKSNIEKAIGAIHTEAKAAGMFGILFTEGAPAVLKENFGLAGIKRHPGASAMKAGVTGVGAVMVYDAIAHGTRGKGEEAQDRSWVTRVGEGAGGAVIMAVGGLHGRR